MMRHEVRKVLREKELSCERLAMQLGISISTMSNWLRFEVVPRSRKRRELVAGALGLPVAVVWPDAD